MKIGIDIDDTISNTAEYLIEEAIKYDKLYKKKGIIDITTYDFCGLFNWNKNDKEDFYKYVHDNDLHNMTVKEYAKEVINELRKEGHEIYIITRRDINIYKNPYQQTSDWLIKNNIEFDKLVVQAKDKGCVCKEHHIDLFIDDLPSNCERAHELGINVLIFDSPYNKEENRFQRVENWKEIYNIVNGVR